MPTLTLDDFVSRAKAMLPRVRERARQTEQQRRLPEETIAEIKEASFHRIFQPARYGGHQLDYGPAQVALGGILGQACGSTGWVQSIFTSHSWITGLFPREGQDAVWEADPDSIIVTAFSTSNGSGRSAEGGYRLTGQWQFSSGVDYADWVLLLTPIVDDAPERYLRFCLVPRRDFKIIDTWFVAGLRGTGSKDVLVKNIFVPSGLTLDTRHTRWDEAPGAKVSDCWIYRLPLTGLLQFNVSVPALGMARGALKAYVDELKARPDRADHMGRQLRVAEAAAEIDAAEALWLLDAEEIVRLGRAGGPIGVQQQVRYLRDLAYAPILCVRAVDRLASNVGAHGIQEDSPFQRAFRDIHALANHVGVAWDISALPYGRVALGLDTGDHRL